MMSQGDAAVPPAPRAETVEAGKSPAMVEALANQAQMASGPRPIGEFKPAYSDEQRAAARLECAARPDKLFVDDMKVEGPIARRMAEKAK